MFFFKSKQLEWWQVGAIKLSLLSLGVAAGAYWPEVFAEYITPLIVVGVVAGVYSLYVWSKR